MNRFVIEVGDKSTIQTSKTKTSQAKQSHISMFSSQSDNWTGPKPDTHWITKLDEVRMTNEKQHSILDIQNSIS